MSSWGWAQARAEVSDEIQREALSLALTSSFFCFLSPPFSSHLLPHCPSPPSPSLPLSCPSSLSPFLPAEENHDHHLLCGAGGSLGVIHWGDAGLVGPSPLSLPDPSPTTLGAIPPPPLSLSPAPGSPSRQTQAAPPSSLPVRPWSPWTSPHHGPPPPPHVDSSRRDYTCTPTCMPPPAHAQDVWTPQRVCVCV